MFDASDKPRLFGVDPGVDFPRAVVSGLEDRLRDAPPHDWAQVQIIANSARMAARIREVLLSGPARLLPRLSLITDIAALYPAVLKDQTPALPPTRRKLDLAGPIQQLLDIAPELGGTAQALDLAESLAKLMDEMQGEGVGAETLANLDVSDQSGHWQRALAFVRVAADYADASDGLDPEAAQRRAVLALIAAWEVAPPRHPVIVVGSTGSRGTTALLMQAVARLPQGAVVLPGFDRDMPDRLWPRLTKDTPEEDHPQYRFAALMRDLDLAPGDINHWSCDRAPDAARGKMISLALRPAPVTHFWRSEAPGLGDLQTATKDITWVEAPDPRAEANAIALRLRQAAEDGTTAALISPDRMLTRRVAAALDRWGIVPDDSAGVPVTLTPPGRLLLQLADLWAEGQVAADALLALLKHPLTASGAGARGPHMLTTRAYELHLRRYGPPAPSAADIRAWAKAHDQEAWGLWLEQALFAPSGPTLPDQIARHLAVAEQLTNGPEGAQGGLWDTSNGRTVKHAMAGFSDLATPSDTLTPHEYARLMRSHLNAAQNVRAADPTHPNLLIWGTLEARVQGADLVILGGLNDGVWPESAEIDPWLNRAMRLQAGLLLPERKIGLSAHDFQQAVAAPKVWVTRAIKTDEAETIPSRWINRLTTLLKGLDAQKGPAALEQMRMRGARWVEKAARLDLAPQVTPAPRPAPIPPVLSRPRRLSVTEIKTLIRDPYAIYAKHILRLRPLDPLVGEADARMRGTMLHDIVETFIRRGLNADAALTRADLERIGEEVLSPVPWPAARRLWQARLRKIAPWFVETEETRQSHGSVAAVEIKGELTLPHMDFTLVAKADRIDMTPRGQARLYDYKTGTAPTKAQQGAFDKQLMLETAMLERGAFEGLGPVDVDYAGYIGLGPTPSEVPAAAREDEDWPRFVALITTFLDPDHPLTARRAMEKDGFGSDYDHLSRYGEWTATQDAKPKVLT